MEQSAEYLNQDGLVTCLMVYADTERELLRGTLEHTQQTSLDWSGLTVHLHIALVLD